MNKILIKPLRITRRFRLDLTLILTIWFGLSVSVLYGQSEISIIPMPNEVKIGEGEFVLNNETKISGHLKTTSLVQGFLKDDFDITLAIENNKIKSNYIKLELDTKVDLSNESYVLEITNKGIEISASHEQGLFYGIQTIKQIALSNGAVDSQISFPILTIKDTPRFSWRAYMLDEGRYFKGKIEVKKMLDQMALLKMNVFHWHLTEDQGWRIEIKKYPLLTEIGSKRDNTQIGEWRSPKRSGEPHEGFYTQDDIKEIVAYAAERHITVVPEIEMPGHSSAAIAAYPWLGAGGKKITVPVEFGVGKDVYNVADPKVFEFLTDVLDEVMALFPSKVIHIGGDEVKYDFWKDSEMIADFMQEKGLKSPADLQIYFTNKISQYIESKGRRMMGWNEIMGSNLHEYQDEKDTKVEQQLAKGTVVHFWKGSLELAEQAAEGGYDIVNSLHSNSYLDYDYNSISLEKAYGFDPIPAGLDAKFHQKVIGSGCQMWGEWIPNPGSMHFQTYPRIAAYAEVGWTALKNKDYERFEKGLKTLQEEWTKKKIYFAPLDVVNPHKK